MVYKCIDKTFSGDTIAHARLKTLTTQDKFGIKNEIISSQQLAEELQQPIIIKFGKRKVHSN